MASRVQKPSGPQPTITEWRVRHPKQGGPNSGTRIVVSPLDAAALVVMHDAHRRTRVHEVRWDTDRARVSPPIDGMVIDVAVDGSGLHVLTSTRLAYLDLASMTWTRERLDERPMRRVLLDATARELVLGHAQRTVCERVGADDYTEREPIPHACPDLILDGWWYGSERRVLRAGVDHPIPECRALVATAAGVLGFGPDTVIVSTKEWSRPPRHGPLVVIDPATLAARQTDAADFMVTNIFGLDGMGRAVVVGGDMRNANGKPRLALIDLDRMALISSRALLRGFGLGAMHPSGVLTMLGLRFATWERAPVTACAFGGATMVECTKVDAPR